MRGDKLMNIIKKRRSVRRFRKGKLSNALIRNILEAGRWAPSGLNNQPWRFKILAGSDKDKLAEFTEYRHILHACDKAILVFLDRESSYNRDKDLMAIGACIQNMLLYIHAQGLGACWLGEILKNKRKICAWLGLSSLELVAVIAVGNPRSVKRAGRRKRLDTLLV